MVHVGPGAAAGVEPDIAALDAFGIDQLTAVGLDIFFILPGTEPRGIVVVIIEYRLDVLDKVRIIGYLDDDMAIGAGLGMIMPERYGKDFLRVLEINLHPLQVGKKRRMCI